MAAKIKFPVSTPAEITKMVEEFFEQGGVIRVMPTRYASGYFKSDVVSISKAR